MHQRLPIHLLLWNILRVVRHKDRPGSVLVQKSGHVDDDVQIYAFDAFHEMDGRNIREVLDWYRGEDAGDLKRSELNELVGNLNQKFMTDEKINPKILMDEKSWKTWKSSQKIVRNEELVQNGVINEDFGKNFVMNVKIDPQVVMDLSTLKIGG